MTAATHQVLSVSITKRFWIFYSLLSLSLIIASGDLHFVLRRLRLGRGHRFRSYRCSDHARLFEHQRDASLHQIRT